jgi:hypothetical protein
VNYHPTRPITVPMASDKKDRKAMTSEEKHEEWCNMIGMLTTIHDDLQTIGDQDLIDKMEVMVAIRSLSMVDYPIVNCFDHHLDEQEVKLPMPPLPPGLPSSINLQRRCSQPLLSLITMKTATPAPRAEIALVRVKQIKEVVASAGELGLDPCADDGGILVGVTDEEQVTRLHGELLPVSGGPCHGCHRPRWRADFVTTGSVDASASFISNTTSVFFMSSFVVKEKITRRACFHGVSYSAPTSQTQKLKLMREGGHFTYSSTLPFTCSSRRAQT